MTPPVDTLPLAAPSELPVAIDAARVEAPAPTAATQLTSDVVVITQDSHAELARSLAAIREAAAIAGAGLLFIDLGSADETRSFAARHAPGAQGIWLGAHDGLSDALAAAAACSTAEVLVVLRPPLKPSSPMVIADMVSHLEEHPYAAAAAPAIRCQTGSILQTAHPAPRDERFSRVECALGHAIAIRRRDVIRATSTRRRRSTTHEDLDLCLDLRRRGREIHYLNSVEWLDASGAVASRVSETSREVSRLATRFMRRHPAQVLRLAGQRTRQRRIGHAIARAFDIVASAVLITVLAPLFLGIAVAIRLDSAGPALFRQRRLGRNARGFEMFKFRTMFHQADHSLHQEFVRSMISGGVPPSENGNGGPVVFKIHPDPRITRVGRILRRTSLDELPQLFNILRGDMSFVGFRPPIPYEVAEYPDWYFRRFDSKPGLTGLWQVSGRNECSYEEMVCLDIEYANRRSLVLDLILLVRTVGVVISGRGAY